MPEIIYERYSIAPFQKKIIEDPARFTVTEAATKVGKTSMHGIWLLEETFRLKRNQSTWWVAPVFSQAEIAFKRMKEKISDKTFFKVNESKLTLTLPTGAIIAFKSAERPDNLYGEDVYAAVFDEFPRARQDAWIALRTTLTATQGRCKFIGNVKGKGNWGYDLARQAQDPLEVEYSYHKITAYEAAEAFREMGITDGVITFEEIEKAKRDMPELAFKALYLAESTGITNPFGMNFIDQCTFEMTSGPAVCFGIDLAKYTDFTAIVGLDRAGCVCYFDRFQKDWRQTIQTILALPNVPMNIDSTGVGDAIVEEIQRSRGNVNSFRFTAFTKQQIMEGLAAAIQQRKIQFPDGQIKKELQEFEFEYTRTGVRYSAPPGVHDDCVCALALAVDCHKTAVNSGSYSWI